MIISKHLNTQFLSSHVQKDLMELNLQIIRRPEAYFGPYQTSMMEFFLKAVNR